VCGRRRPGLLLEWFRFGRERVLKLDPNQSGRRFDEMGIVMRERMTWVDEEVSGLGNAGGRV
jgi:hypothetical protein